VQIISSYLAGMILERQADPDTVSYNLSVLDLHVKFLDLCNSQIPEGLVRSFNGILCSLLPGYITCSHQFDDLVNTPKYSLPPSSINVAKVNIL